MAVDEDNGQLDPMGPESYEHLLEDYSHFAPPAADEVLQGTVLGITAKDVIIDFGYKSEGIVPLDQFLSPSGEVTVKRGDVVDVMIDHGEQVEGYVLLSHTKAARLRIWDNLEKAQNEQLVLSGRVLGRVKGGLAVDVGIKAFMPGSQADPRPVHNLDALVGQGPLQHIFVDQHLPLHKLVIELPRTILQRIERRDGQHPHLRSINHRSPSC